MTTQRKLLTAEDLYALPDDGLHHYELIDGVLVQMSPTNRAHGRVVAMVGHLLLMHVLPRRLGEVQAGDPGFVAHRGPDTVLAPDVCFIQRERLDEPPMPGFQRAVPDLVVEVISPGDRPGEMHRKTERWLAAGALLVWNVYPDAEEIVAFRPDAAPHTYTHEDTLDAEPVLPEFSVPVADVFAVPGRE